MSFLLYAYRLINIPPDIPLILKVGEGEIWFPATMEWEGVLTKEYHYLEKNKSLSKWEDSKCRCIPSSFWLVILPHPILFMQQQF